MINLQKLNQDLVEIVEKRIQLADLKYDDSRYDEIEEQLHSLEDDFLKKYDDYLEDILLDIHDEYCPETEVLSPIAYLAKNYIHKDHKSYDTHEDQGVWVEIEEIPEKEAHLVLLPNPLRIVLTSGSFRKPVWKAEEK
ncbi:MAG: hypothetical protein MUC49_11915 [Raineya sp.]|jgi:hypothetical protein|nr:hypothetical protein [Raineya sp.]